tara:strand:+ start:899 stop:1714 length:816 start_codon:yes stop_codon:yes gene_type:complete
MKKMMQLKKTSLLLTLFFGVITIAYAKDTKKEDVVIEDPALYEDQMLDLDPLEPLNRGIFVINTFLDGLLIRPMAYAYEDLVADVIKDRISNVLDNLASPIVFVNDLLQGEGTQAMNTFMRFFINSTFGLLGLFDPASDIGLDQKNNDFGTTFRRWGIGAGPYIILPLFGPSSFRDLAGDSAGYFADPYNWYMRVHHKKEWIYARLAVKALVKRQQFLELTERLDKTADPYAQYRILYMQNRKIIDAIESSAVPEDVIDVSNTAPLEAIGK